MTAGPKADEPDPIVEWLELRLEQIANEAAAGPSPAAEENLLQDIQLAERCAEILDGVWPERHPAVDSTHDGSIDPTQHPDRDRKASESRLESLGRFQIQRLLGRGGMGNVFLAFDPTLERPVALKVPRFDVTGDPELRERFLLEARAAAKLSHPNLVEVYDAGQEGTTCYIASAYCNGPDLEHWLAAREGPVEPELAARLIARLAEAIHCCHEIGIIHRDLKPANILLVTTSEDQGTAQNGMPFVPKITDFGLARALEDSLIQTRSSLIVGTPLYMAPEQAEGRSEDIGPATDVFALGAILYELLTGRPPFEGRTTLTVLSRIQREEPPSPSRLQRGISSGLEAICMKCLRKRPEERYASAAELASDLENWRNGRPISARRFTIWDRFRTWSRQPERIRDAGIAAMAWNALIAATTIIHSLYVLLDFNNPLPVGGRFVVECLVVGSIQTIFCWVGWRIIRGDRWAYWAGFAQAFFQWFVGVQALAGGPIMFDMYKELPEARYLILVNHTTLLSIQLLAFLVALRAPSAE